MKNSTCLYRLLGAFLFVFSFAAYGQLPTKPTTTFDVGFENPSSMELEVHQHDLRAIVNWESFSIGADSSVKFIQSPDQAILNRVTGGNLSSIAGELTGGGTVWLINPNGVLIGSGARIETQSFIASTLDVPDSDFLNPGTNTFTFEGNNEASIVNAGHIKARNGDVLLVARIVDNQGELYAPEGHVMLAAGDKVEVDMHSYHPENRRIAVRSSLGGDVGVNHEGIIQAAQAELSAAGGNIYGFAVNVGGSIQANGYDGTAGGKNIRLVTDGGRIKITNGAELSADTGAVHIEAGTGVVSIAGRVDVESSTAEEWGQILVNAKQIDILNGAELTASNSHASGEAGVIELEKGLADSTGSIVIHEGASLLAEGNAGSISLNNADVRVSGALLRVGENGEIRLVGENISLAGSLLAADGRVSLVGAEKIQAADAIIQTGQLSLYGIGAADISGDNNAIAQLMLFSFAEEFGVPSAENVGDLHVNSGRGTLNVIREGPAPSFQNLTLISEGDLRLDEYFDVEIADRATLASLEGKLINDSQMPLFETAQFIRLYARDESELGGLIPDNGGDVVFPDDPDQQSRIVFYNIVDALAPEPEPNPSPQPDPGEQPDDPAAEQREQVSENQSRDSAHQQQQGNEGTHFFVGVDPATGETVLFVGNGRVQVTDDAPSRTVLPSEQIQLGNDGLTNDRSFEDPDGFIEDLINNTSEEVLAALLEAKRLIDEENAAFIERLRAELGDSESGFNSDPEADRERYRNNLDQLINSIITQATDSGRLDSEQIEQLIADANAGRGAGDLPPPDGDGEDRPTDERLSAAEQQRRAQMEELQRRREEQRQELEQKQQDAKGQQQALRERLEEQLRKQEEAKQRAADEARRKAEERFVENLNEEQRRAFEERQNQQNQRAEGPGEQEQYSGDGDVSPPVAEAPRPGDPQPGSQDEQAEDSDEQQRLGDNQRRAEEERQRQQQERVENNRQLLEERRAQQGSPKPPENGGGALPGSSGSGNDGEAVSGGSGSGNGGGVVSGGSDSGDDGGAAAGGSGSGGGGGAVRGILGEAGYVEVLEGLAGSDNADAQRLVQILNWKTAAEVEAIVEQLLPRDTAEVSDVSSQASAATRQSVRTHLRNQSQQMGTTRSQSTGPVPVNVGGL